MTNEAAPRFEEIFYTQRNGLRLHARRYPAVTGASGRPAVCLPGLTRNCRDFHELALALSAGPSARDVYALDMRGRGLSDYDRDWRNYAVPIEAQDVIDFMAMTELHEPAIIGTSRGGLITMVLASVQPGIVGPVVLNDIGPVIEAKGLGRIASYVGRTPVPRDWSEAGTLVRELFGRAFSGVAENEWEAIARQMFNDRNGRPAQAYDPSLGRAMSVLDGPVPALWPQFQSLRTKPVLVIRGQNSDLLSAETISEMHRRHPRLSALVVAGEGHAPLLRDAPTIAAISEFLATNDTFEAAAPA